MFSFLKDLLFPKIAVQKGSSVTYRTDFSNLLLLANLLALFIIFKQYRRNQVLEELCRKNL